MFFNTNLPYERVRLLKTEKELLDMPEDSKDIYKSGITEKYIHWPTTGSFELVEIFVLQSLQQCIIQKFLMMITIFNQTIYQIP